MKKKVQIGVLGLNHKTADIEIREKFSFSEETVIDLYHKSFRAGLNEFVYVSTCNRAEFYFVANKIEIFSKKIVKILEKISNLSFDSFKDKVYFYENQEAVHHLLNVASSLDSMVVGENEIVGQLKQSFTTAVNLKSTGPLLNKLFHQAFKTAKEVRSKTNISRHSLSIAYIATDLANSLFPDLSKRKALLIGAGEMGELILKYLTKHKIGEITIANRSLGNAKKISQQFNLKAKTVLLDDIEKVAEKVDIIISSITIPHFLITTENIENIMPNRKTRPLFLIDISVPRNIDPKINNLEFIHLYNIDDLKSMADKNLNNRLREIDLVQIIIEENIKDFLNWMEELEVAPTITNLQNKFEQIRQKELGRYKTGKLKHLSKKDFKLIEDLTSQIMTKTLHNPIMNLKKHHKDSKGDQPRSKKFKKKTKFVEDLFTK